MMSASKQARSWIDFWIAEGILLDDCNHMKQRVGLACQAQPPQVLGMTVFSWKVNLSNGKHMGGDDLFAIPFTIVFSLTIFSCLSSLLHLVLC